jgi:DtxR family manganese transport transcriptional regulator
MKRVSETSESSLSRTRLVHAEETAQDYVEIIAELIDKTGEARAIDIARRLNVSHVSVGKTLRRLERLGLLTSKPYRSIFLTETGKKLAIESRMRHELVHNFLVALGVPAKVAAVDSEGIEHHVSPETLKAFGKYLQQLKKKR